MKNTKEEKFLIKLHDLASRKGDAFSPIDCHLVGKELGLGVPSTKNIVKVLAMSHLIKKSGDKKVHLTDNGHVLINQLKSES